MNKSILELIARVIGWFEPLPDFGPGHPSAETARVLATLRRFLRESTPWRRLRATGGMASRATLRPRVTDWAQSGVLGKVHPMLFGMLRGQPDLARDLIGDSCPVRGDGLAGPNNTDRSKKGTKHHVAVTGCGVPVAYAATAANVNDTLLFECLFRTASVVKARVRAAFADKARDAGINRELCRKSRAEPRTGKRGQPHGAGLGRRHWPVKRANSWRFRLRRNAGLLLGNKRLGLRCDRLDYIVGSLLQATCISLVACRLTRQF